MKTLKITFLLLAVLLLTVSGQSSDTLAKDDAPTFETTKTNSKLLSHIRAKSKIPTNG